MVIIHVEYVVIINLNNFLIMFLKSFFAFQFVTSIIMFLKSVYNAG